MVSGWEWSWEELLSNFVTDILVTWVESSSTLMMISAKVVETSVTSTDNSRPYLTATLNRTIRLRDKMLPQGWNHYLTRLFDNFGYISQPTFFSNIKSFDVLIRGDRF